MNLRVIFILLIRTKMTKKNPELKAMQRVSIIGVLLKIPASVKCKRSLLKMEKMIKFKLEHHDFNKIAIGKQWVKE